METSEITKKRIADFLKEGKRFDGRKLLEYRNLSIELGVSNKAEGSARVKLGKTDVMVGVKMDVMEPYRDSPNEGVLSAGAELTQMASERVESGPPGFDAIEVGRLMDRGVRESHFIDFEKLCIKEGEKVWTVMIDFYSVNDDGSLIDAASIGAVAALMNAKMPKYDEKKEVVEFGEWTTKKLPLSKSVPVTMTFYKIGSKIVLDPTREEEDASTAKLTLTLVEEDGKKSINASQKGNEAGLTMKEMEEIFDIAEKEYDNLLAKFEKAYSEAEKAKD
jgi:exosome complex component RRP42